MKPEYLKIDLNEIRASKALWNDLIYAEGKNYPNRYAVAIQLQYDFRDTDYELIEFLMENEILHRSNASFQGIGECLLLISYLLAKFKKLENVFLFEKAKCANFDTYCGYDSEFIFSAGVEKTCDYLEHIGITEENKFLYDRKDELSTLYSEEDINIFLEHMGKDYPSQYDDETIQSLLDRAIFFKDYNESNRLYHQLEEENPKDFRTLYYYGKVIKNYKKAIYYQHKIYEQATDYQEKVSALHNIAEIYCTAKDYDNAYITAVESLKYLKRFNIWKQIGLGRMLSETWCDICLGFIELGELGRAIKTFKHADHMLSNLNSYSYNLLEKAYACSLKIDKKKLINKYKILFDREQERINRLKS